MLKAIMQLLLVIGLLILPPLTDAIYAQTRVAGEVVEVDCGDATNLRLKTTAGKQIWGTCLEQWCYDVCSSEFSRKKIIGRKLSASVRIANMEEPEYGVLVNEFYDVMFDE